MQARKGASRGNRLVSFSAASAATCNKSWNSYIFLQQEQTTNCGLCPATFLASLSVGVAAESKGAV